MLVKWFDFKGFSVQVCPTVGDKTLVQLLNLPVLILEVCVVVTLLPEKTESAVLAEHFRTLDCILLGGAVLVDESVVNIVVGHFLSRLSGFVPNKYNVSY